MTRDYKMDGDTYEKGMAALERASTLLFVIDASQLLDHPGGSPEEQRNVIAAQDTLMIVDGLVEEAKTALSLCTAAPVAMRGMDASALVVWRVAEQKLEAVRQQLNESGLEDSEIDRLSNVELDAIDRVLLLPTASLAHAIRKAELAAELCRPIASFITEARAVAGIGTDELAPPKPASGKVSA